MTNIYSNSALVYDKTTDVKIGSEDISFYLNKIKQQDSVLELGCGTGRVSVELAKKGIKVHGLDLSAQMLQVFEDKIKDQSLQNSIKITKGDMSSFSLNSKFNWIIFPFRAFQALTTKNQRENCLKCVNEHLEDDGKVVIQIFDPLPEIFKKWTELKNLDVRIWDKTTNKYVERYSIGESHSEIQQTIKFHYLFKVISQDNKVEHQFTDPMKLGYLYHEQAKDLFHKNGFKVINTFSDWNETTYDPNIKKELIYLLSKKNVG